MHLSFGYMTRLSIPNALNIRRIKILSGESGRICHVAQVEEIFPDIWQANRAVAEAYGLTPDDFEYILSTFPVFARKRPEFFGYLQQQVAAWKTEFQGAKVPARPYPFPEQQEIQATAETNTKYGEKRAGNRIKKNR